MDSKITTTDSTLPEFEHVEEDQTAKVQDPDIFLAFERSTHNVSLSDALSDAGSLDFSQQTVFSTILQLEIYPFQGIPISNCHEDFVHKMFLVESPVTFEVSPVFNMFSQGVFQTQTFGSIPEYSKSLNGGQEENVNSRLGRPISKPEHRKQNQKLFRSKKEKKLVEKSLAYFLKNFPGTISQRVKKLILDDPNAYQRLLDGEQFFTDESEEQNFRELVRTIQNDDRTWKKLTARLKTNPEFGRVFLSLVLKFLNNASLIEEWISGSEKMSIENKEKLRDEYAKELLREKFNEVQANLV